MSDLKVFQCPNCQNYINNLLTNCRFCSIPLTQDLLSSSINKEDFVNAAYNTGNNVRNGGVALATTFALAFIPFVGIFAGIAHYILLITLPFGIVYFLFKYGTTSMDDKTFKDAKKNCWIGLGIWIFFFALRVLLLMVFFGAALR